VPYPLAYGAFAFGPRDAQPFAAVHVGVQSGAFHFAYFNTRNNYTKAPAAFSLLSNQRDPHSGSKERDEAG